MKKIITIISILTLSFGLYAEDLKSKETLVKEYKAIVQAITGENITSDATDSSKKTKKLSPSKHDQIREARLAFVQENADSIAVLFTDYMNKISSSDYKQLTPIVDTPYNTLLIVYANSVIDIVNTDAYTFKVASYLFYNGGKYGQLAYIESHNISYDTLKADNFTVDGCKLFGNSIIELIIKNNDYATFKVRYKGFDYDKAVANFIKTNVLSISNSTTAYNETIYWENVFIKSNNTKALKAIQNLQDIIFLRQQRDNKL